MLSTSMRTAASPSAIRPAVSAVAVSLGAVFYAVGRLRRGRRKPLHPDGAVLPGTVHRDGAPTSWGAPWLDATGEHEATVRLSRSAGLPAPLPDVLGLALRVRVDGRDADLLLSTAGRGRVGRFFLRPRLSPGRGAYTTLLPYRSPRGPVLIAAEPEQPRRLPPDPAGLADRLAAEPMRFTLSCAAPRGPWRQFGTLEIGGASLRPSDRAGVDAPVSFDPVLNPLPGLVMYDAVGRVRATTYASARRARGLPG
jgi:hypothetical protein